jgi:hypothetical protein
MMYAHNLFRPRISVVRLGQALPSVQALEARASTALAKYSDLMSRAALITDDATRQAIMNWVGNGKVPGSPSERYLFVQQDQSSNAPWDENRTKRLDDLEAADAELETRVINGEKSGSYSPSGVLSLVDANGKLTGTGISLVALGVLALIIVPLTIK